MLEQLVDGLLSEQRGSDRGPTVIYECRRCGTTLDAEATACPYCGPTEIARFEF